MSEPSRRESRRDGSPRRRASAPGSKSIVTFVKKTRVIGWGFAYLSFSLLSGCVSHSRNGLEPLTKEQKMFCDIRALHEENKTDAVIREARKFLTQYAEGALSVPVRYYLAVSLEKEGRANQARKYYNDLLILSPKTGWSDLARSHLKGLEQ